MTLQTCNTDIALNEVLQQFGLVSLLLQANTSVTIDYSFEQPSRISLTLVSPYSLSQTLSNYRGGGIINALGTTFVLDGGTSHEILTDGSGLHVTRIAAVNIINFLLNVPINTWNDGTLNLRNLDVVSPYKYYLSNPAGNLSKITRNLLRQYCSNIGEFEFDTTGETERENFEPPRDSVSFGEFLEQRSLVDGKYFDISGHGVQLLPLNEGQPIFFSMQEGDILSETVSVSYTVDDNTELQDNTTQNIDFTLACDDRALFDLFKQPYVLEPLTVQGTSSDGFDLPQPLPDLIPRRFPDELVGRLAFNFPIAEVPNFIPELPDADLLPPPDPINQPRDPRNPDRILTRPPATIFEEFGEEGGDLIPEVPFFQTDLYQRALEPFLDIPDLPVKGEFDDTAPEPEPVEELIDLPDAACATAETPLSFRTQDSDQTDGFGTSIPANRSTKLYVEGGPTTQKIKECVDSLGNKTFTSYEKRGLINTFPILTNISSVNDTGDLGGENGGLYENLIELRMDEQEVDVAKVESRETTYNYRNIQAWRRDPAGRRRYYNGYFLEGETSEQLKYQKAIARPIPDIKTDTISAIRAYNIAVLQFWQNINGPGPDPDINRVLDNQNLVGVIINFLQIAQSPRAFLNSTFSVPEEREAFKQTVLDRNNSDRKVSTYGIFVDEAGNVISGEDWENLNLEGLEDHFTLEDLLDLDLSSPPGLNEMIRACNLAAGIARRYIIGLINYEYGGGFLKTDIERSISIRTASRLYGSRIVNSIERRQNNEEIRCIIQQLGICRRNLGIVRAACAQAYALAEEARAEAIRCRNAALAAFNRKEDARRVFITQFVNQDKIQREQELITFRECTDLLNDQVTRLPTLQLEIQAAIAELGLQLINVAQVELDRRSVEYRIEDVNEQIRLRELRAQIDIDNVEQDRTLAQTAFLQETDGFDNQQELLTLNRDSDLLEIDRAEFLRSSEVQREIDELNSLNVTTTTAYNANRQDALDEIDQINESDEYCLDIEEELLDIIDSLDSSVIPEPLTDSEITNRRNVISVNRTNLTTEKFNLNTDITNLDNTQSLFLINNADDINVVQTNFAIEQSNFNTDRLNINNIFTFEFGLIEIDRTNAQNSFDLQEQNFDAQIQNIETDRDSDVLDLEVERQNITLELNPIDIELANREQDIAVAEENLEDLNEELSEILLAQQCGFLTPVNCPEPNLDNLDGLCSNVDVSEFTKEFNNATPIFEVPSRVASLPNLTQRTDFMKEPTVALFMPVAIKYRTRWEEFIAFPDPIQFLASDTILI